MIPGDLRKTLFFSNLSEEDLLRVYSCGSLKIYIKGATLLNQEEMDTSVFFILDGAVRIFRINKDGKEQVLTYMKAGDVFNLPTAFLGKHEAPAFAQALSKVEAFAISHDNLYRLTEKYPAIALAVIRDLSIKLGYMTNLVHNLSLLDVRSRLAKFLLEKHQMPDNSTRWTHERIALQIGTSREVVSRMLKALMQDGLITMEQGKLVVVNEKGLLKTIND